MVGSAQGTPDQPRDGGPDRHAHQPGLDAVGGQRALELATRGLDDRAVDLVALRLVEEVSRWKLPRALVGRWPEIDRDGW